MFDVFSFRVVLFAPRRDPNPEAGGRNRVPGEMHSVLTCLIQWTPSFEHTCAVFQHHFKWVHSWIGRQIWCQQWNHWEPPGWHSWRSWRKRQMFFHSNMWVCHGLPGNGTQSSERTVIIVHIPQKMRKIRNMPYLFYSIIISDITPSSPIPWHVPYVFHVVPVEPRIPRLSGESCDVCEVLKDWGRVTSSELQGEWHGRAGRAGTGWEWDANGIAMLKHVETIWKLNHVEPNSFWMVFVGVWSRMCQEWVGWFVGWPVLASFFGSFKPGACTREAACSQLPQHQQQDGNIFTGSEVGGGGLLKLEVGISMPKTWEKDETCISHVSHCATLVLVVEFVQLEISCLDLLDLPSNQRQGALTLCQGELAALQSSRDEAGSCPVGSWQLTKLERGSAMCRAPNCAGSSPCGRVGGAEWLVWNISCTVLWGDYQGKTRQQANRIQNWLVVWNIFYFPIYWE